MRSRAGSWRSRLLDYRKSDGEYERLVEAAQKDTGFPAFMAVKASSGTLWSRLKVACRR